MRQKFKIYYSKDHADPSKAGTLFKPSGKDMLVMNNQGIFFLFNGEPYCNSISKLVDRIGNYDVKWNDC